MKERAPPNGLEQLSLHVVRELERLNAAVENLESEMHHHRVEVAVLKVKVAMWAAIASAITSAVVSGIVMSVFKIIAK